MVSYGFNLISLHIPSLSGLGRRCFRAQRQLRHAGIVTPLRQVGIQLGVAPGANSLEEELAGLPATHGRVPQAKRLKACLSIVDSETELRGFSSFESTDVAF